MVTYVIVILFHDSLQMEGARFNGNICYHLNDSCLSVTYVIFIAEIFWAEIQMWEFFIMVIYVIVIFPSSFDPKG